MLNLLAAITLGFQSHALVCPVTGEAAMGASPTVFFAGAKVSLCCADCKANMLEHPREVLATAAKAGRVSGIYLYDPVSGARVRKTSLFTSDYGAIRFPFENAQDKKLFDADPKKYGTLPQKEALYCAVENHPVASYELAQGFVDYKGVRYYVCCADCLAEMGTHPEKYFANAAGAVREPKATEAPKAQ